jgi:hypothetical protein
MRHKLLQFSVILIAVVCLSGIGYADTPPSYSFSFESGKRLIWDRESNSGLYYPSGFTFDQDFLPVGLSIQSGDLSIELIPQAFPDQQETFWNFAFYSTSQFQNTAALLNLSEKRIYYNETRIYRISYERDALAHETNHYRYHQLFFVERGTYQGDLLIIRSNEPLSTEEALSYYQSGEIRDPSILQSPSSRVRAPISNPERSHQRLLPNQTASDLPLWGLFQPSAPRSLSNVHALENQLDTSFPLILRYTNFADSLNQLQIDLGVAKSDQRIVELTLQTNENNQLDSSIYSVLNGTYDAALRQLARIVQEQGDPVLFRLNNEMNGDWCNYSALYYGLETNLYRDTWNWIYTIFQEEGATNARWVFNPNERSFPQYRWNHMLAYLPSPSQIDAVGLTGYNTGTYYPGETWRSFAEIFDPIYAEYDELFDFPFLIAEFSSSSIGGDKAKWVADMFEHLPNYPRIEALIWWDHADYASGGKIARPYYLDESLEVLDAFRDGLIQFNANQFQ